MAPLATQADVGGISFSGSSFQEMALPALREELSLYMGPVSLDGSPTWSLHDPVSNRFFRIGWLEFEILSRWSLGSAERLLSDLRETTTLDASSDDLERVARFLATHDLLQGRGPQALERLLLRVRMAKPSPLLFLLKNYLFFRIPLIRPDRLLDRCTGHISWIWSNTFLAVALICSFLGGWLVLKRWDAFATSFSYFFTLEGFLFMGVALSLTKIAHEFGHACTAKRFGCRIPSMGVAFMVLWPILYTDASDAWKLQSKRQRLAIAASGIAVELIIASFALLSWSLLPEGAWRSVAFLLATSTWIVTLGINLNPFMRFDGYYLLSDALGIPNLQDRSFSLGRWKLREVLFGFGDPPPEFFPTGMRRLLLIYSYSVWIYRFFLFLGIALTVYYLFFKILGIFLMLIEVVWFIALPIAKEIKGWAERRKDLMMNRQTLRTIIIVVAGVILFLFPWRGTVSAPALWRAGDQARVYVPRPAQMVDIKVLPGQHVKEGEVLFRMRSPDLEEEVRQGERRISYLRWAVEFQGMNADLKERALLNRQALESELTAQSGRREEQRLLSVSSPLNGIVAQIMDPLHPGDWLAANELLAVVVTPTNSRIEAFIKEEDLHRIRPGARGFFFAEDIARAPFEVMVESIDAGSSRIIAEPWMGSIHGGEIPVRRSAEGNYVPEIPVYRVSLSPVADRPAPAQILRGNLQLAGERECFAVRIWRGISGVLIRESGF